MTQHFPTRQLRFFLTAPSPCPYLPDRFERKVFALAGGQLFGLTAHETARPGDRFDVAAPGLDHVGFACPDRAAVAAWQTHLDLLGIAHGGVVEADYGWALSFTDPDGNPLEFFAPAS